MIRKGGQEDRGSTEIQGTLYDAFHSKEFNKKWKDDAWQSPDMVDQIKTVHDEKPPIVQELEIANNGNSNPSNVIALLDDDEEQPLFCEKAITTQKEIFVDGSLPIATKGIIPINEKLLFASTQKNTPASQQLDEDGNDGTIAKEIVLDGDVLIASSCTDHAKNEELARSRINRLIMSAGKYSNSPSSTLLCGNASIVMESSEASQQDIHLESSSRSLEHGKIIRAARRTMSSDRIMPSRRTTRSSRGSFTLRKPISQEHNPLALATKQPLTTDFDVNESECDINGAVDSKDIDLSRTRSIWSSSNHGSVASLHHSMHSLDGFASSSSLCLEGISTIYETKQPRLMDSRSIANAFENELDVFDDENCDEDDLEFRIRAMSSASFNGSIASRRSFRSRNSFTSRSSISLERNPSFFTRKQPIMTDSRSLIDAFENELGAIDDEDEDDEDVELKIRALWSASNNGSMTSLRSFRSRDSFASRNSLSLERNPRIFELKQPLMTDSRSVINAFEGELDAIDDEDFDADDLEFRMRAMSSASFNGSLASFVMLSKP
jgi:hypothetical protein